MPTQLTITGTITECTPDPAPVCEKIVYQGTAPGLGNLIGNGTWNRQRRRWVTGTDPQTPAQLSRRARFAGAVAAWHGLDGTARTYWHHIGAARNLPGYNAFISAWLRA